MHLLEFFFFFPRVTRGITFRSTLYSLLYGEIVLNVLWVLSHWLVVSVSYDVSGQAGSLPIHPQMSIDPPSPALAFPAGPPAASLSLWELNSGPQR